MVGEEGEKENLNRGERPSIFFLSTAWLKRREKEEG